MLILLETHSTPTDESLWEKEWGGRCIYAHGTSVSRGIAIFTSKKINDKLKNIHIDIEGRFIILDFCDMDHIVTIVCIYAPNQDTPEYYMCLNELLAARSENKNCNWRL